MSKFTLFILALLLGARSFTATAQKTATTVHPGSVKGILRDTAQNYVLKSATVTIYKAADSTLLNYQITNNYGEFSFKNLPVDLLLKLEISHVGYVTGRKNFTIPSVKNTLDLRTIIMNRQDNTLEEVVIAIPPISVNGDTLEFNAAAFKLDSNATVEDMLKAIPNITLWGDGQITVNGAEVKSLKVNGKSFFEGDPKIALQNISKNALQKVQVYKTGNLDNPRDSTLEMNLKLKKGKDIGYFGKIGAGYGSNGRYEADASINMFSPKMQLALVGAINNINKTANSTRSLMSNSTFKGVGTNVEYEPDFRQSGLNKPAAIGASLTYNFIEKPTYQSKSTLKANYFLQDLNSDYLSESTTTTTIGSSNQIQEKSNHANLSSKTNHKFDTNYEFAKQGHNLTFSQSVNLNQGDNQSQTYRTAGNLDNVLTSTNNSFSTNTFSNNSFNLRAEYRYSPQIMTSKTRLTGFNASYVLTNFTNDSQRLNLTEFRSFTDAGANRDFNRKYNVQNRGTTQDINFSLPGLKRLIFGGGDDWKEINVGLTNKLVLKSDMNDNGVQDLDSATNTYRINPYLNNKVRTNVTEEVPGINIEKTFSKRLSNRFDQNLTFRFHPKLIWIGQNNQSDRSFQNIRRNYRKFAPDGEITYSDSQYGEFYRNYGLNYKTTLRIPDIHQLAPLTDSTNLYNLQRGNINLKESVVQDLNFSFNHYDQSKKNTLNYSFYVSAGLIKNNIVDSLLIDDQNRRTVFLVNANGHKYLNFNGDIKKAFKLKSSELQLSLRSSVNANRNPGYTNTVFAYSSNLNTNSSFSINYTYRSYLALVVGQAYTTSRSKQEAFQTEYKGRNLDTKVSTSYNVTKKFTLNSNVSFNNNSSSVAEDINFTIWNASAVYRFLKGNNAELKFSALDLLRQNNSAINYGTANSFTTGTQNVLTQYFMTTISYYPRQFGKAAAKKQPNQ
jgi:hypothetical protein